jgi:hypothetical protein
MPFGSWSHYALAVPSQFALVVAFFMDFAILWLKNFYFLPCGFDHDEVVPIKACLES